jgi:hypothetical protein
MSDRNKTLAMNPRWGLDTKTDWPTDRWSQNNLNLKRKKTEAETLINKHDHVFFLPI